MDSSETERIVRLLTTYQEQIYRYVFALLPSEHDAKDVVQETCIALCRKFDQYDENRPFLPWAYRFAYLEVLKHREQKQRSPLSLGDDVIELLAREREEQSEVLDARLQALEACLRELPQADFDLIRGRYQVQLPIDDLAQRAKMSHRTLYRNLDRVRRMLFDCVTRRLEVDG